MLGLGSAVGGAPVGAGNYTVYLGASTSLNSSSCTAYTIVAVMRAGTQTQARLPAPLVLKTSLQIRTDLAQYTKSQASAKVVLSGKTSVSVTATDISQQMVQLISRAVAAARTQPNIKGAALLAATGMACARTVSKLIGVVHLAGTNNAKITTSVLSWLSLLQGSARVSTRAKASTAAMAKMGTSSIGKVNSKANATAVANLRTTTPSKVRATSAPMLSLNLQSASRLATRTTLKGNAFVHLPARARVHSKASTTFAAMHLNLGVKAKSAIRTLLAHFRGPRLPVAAVTVTITPPIVLALSSTLPVLAITPQTYVTLTTNEPTPVVLTLV